MSKLYHYLVVGAGIYSSTFAEIMKRRGKSVLIIDKRSHIAGNCYTEKIDDIHVHKYGSHIFQTNKKYVWDYLNTFADFNNYKHTGKVNYYGKIYSFPINMMTLYQLWGVTTPKEAIDKLSQVKVAVENPQNMEEWCLAQMGTELYEIFVKHYSTKQWGKSPTELPISIIKRIPFRLTYNENYYDKAIYQGIPIGGYTKMIENMLDGIKIELDVDFTDIKNKWQKYAKKLVFCGPIDQYFEYKFGELEYRSLQWEHKKLDGDFQGCSIMNYNDSETKFTRIVEHKHFDLKDQKKTIVIWEYPVAWKETKEPYYPINDAINKNTYDKYKKLSKMENKVLISGRLGKFAYLDMDDCVAMAMREAEEF